MFTKVKWLYLTMMICSFYSLVSWADCHVEIEKVELEIDNLSNYHSLMTHKPKMQFKAYFDGISENCFGYLTLNSQNNFQLKSVTRAIPYTITFSDSPYTGLALRQTQSKRKIDLVLDASTVVKSGKYKDVILLQLKDRHNRVLDEYEMVLDISIEPYLNVSLLGFHSTHSVVNLGELLPNKEYSTLPSIKLVTNSDIVIKVNSDNKGSLFHQVFKNKYTIDYTLALASNLIDLKQQSVQHFSFVEKMEYILPVKIKMSDFKEQPAGLYSDTIRFEISPLNY